MVSRPFNNKYFLPGVMNYDETTAHLVKDIFVEDEIGFDLRVFPNLKKVYIKRFNKEMIKDIPQDLEQLTVRWFEGIDEEIFSMKCQNLRIGVFNNEDLDRSKYNGGGNLKIIKH